ENLISCAAGANFSLSPQDVVAASDLIQSADVVLLQLEIPLATVAAAADIAAEAGVKVVLNPAPAPPQPFSTDLLQCVTYLTPNQIEIERLTGVPVTDVASAATAAEKLRSSGVDAVIVTRGKAGALICDSDGSPSVNAFAVE